jgi:hypothetical protein
MDRGKRKVVQEPRFSSHFQQKQTEQGASYKGTTSSRPVVLRTNSLLDNFSFVNFSDAEVIGLFENIGLSLGTQEDIKINIVNKFRTLLKSHFKKVVKDIQVKYSFVLGKDNVLVDISTDILDLS